MKEEFFYMGHHKNQGFLIHTLSGTMEGCADEVSIYSEKDKSDIKIMKVKIQEVKDICPLCDEPYDSEFHGTSCQLFS